MTSLFLLNYDKAELISEEKFKTLFEDFGSFLEEHPEFEMDDETDELLMVDNLIDCDEEDRSDIPPGKSVKRRNFLNEQVDISAEDLQRIKNFRKELDKLELFDLNDDYKREFFDEQGYINVKVDGFDEKNVLGRELGADLTTEDYSIFTAVYDFIFTKKKNTGG